VSERPIRHLWACGVDALRYPGSVISKLQVVVDYLYLYQTTRVLDERLNDLLLNVIIDPDI